MASSWADAFPAAESPAAQRAFLEKHNLWQSFVRECGLAEGATDAAIGVAAVPVGDGNMNLVLRLSCVPLGSSETEKEGVVPAGTAIFKQGPPYVQKYPQFAAPAGRSAVELQFYKWFGSSESGGENATTDANGTLPRLLDSAPGPCCMLLEDLGAGAVEATAHYDHSDSSVRQSLDDAGGISFLLEGMVSFLATLHAREPPSDGDRDGIVCNAAMRELNYEHMFDLPFRADNGLDLDAFTPGLARAFSQTGISDEKVVARIHQLGELYHPDRAKVVAGHVMLHGDFFLGSSLLVPTGRGGGSGDKPAHRVVVIDAEFCFVGPREFDVGILAAHLLLAGEDQARVRRSLIAPYEKAVGKMLDIALVAGFVGVEIGRRLCGVGQLPWLRGPDMLSRKTKLLTAARDFLLGKHDLKA
jgi:5-methylthioribose kinase